MKTLLDIYDCIIESDYVADNSVKEKEVGLHNMRVNYIRFYTPTYDSQGYENGVQKINLDIHFFRKISEKVKELELMTAQMKKDTLPF